MFIHGCKRPENEVRAHTYQALRAPNTVKPHLGLDRSLGQVCMIMSVRCQLIGMAGTQLPSKRAKDPTTLHDYSVPSPVQTRIWGKNIIHLIVDNRDPGDVLAVDWSTP